MSQVGFEPTIPVFQRAKTVRALDRATTGICISSLRKSKLEHSRIPFLRRDRVTTGDISL
jgi:hypothetical protein